MSTLFVLAHLSLSVEATSTILMDPGCPPSADLRSGDGTTRSLSRILGSCVVTLLICVWQTLHFNVPSPQDSEALLLLNKATLALQCFLMPELVVCRASKQWVIVRRRVSDFRVEGYEWSKAHSWFAESGGFVYCEGKGSFMQIDSLGFLRLCKEKRIANPVITEQEITDKSKADALGKFILSLQLSWFMLQVAVRYFSGLAITLVELDTLCMAVLTIILLFFWWHKPLRANFPHIFYSKKYPEGDPDFDLIRVWRSEPSSLHKLIDGIRDLAFTKYDLEASPASKKRHFLPSSRWVEYTEGDEGNIALISLSATWLIFGALHLTAWNFPFPTENEKVIWRGASLVLTGAPILVLVVVKVCDKWYTQDIHGSMMIKSLIMFIALSGTIVSRTVLVSLMFFSLRTLPCSAYQTIAWTDYVPHL